MENRPSITALFKNAAANGLQNSKHKRLFESLQWRQAYLNAEQYEYKLEDTTIRLNPAPPLRVKQILNGELKGLGTGTFVWPAAHVLAKFLEKRYHGAGLKGKRICDIGAGTGLVGLVAALLGGTVVLTDLEILLPLMKQNIEIATEHHPNLQISSTVYNWEEKQRFQEDSYDLLLISDCVLPKLYPISMLVDAVDYLLTKDTVAIFSYEHRPFPAYDPRQEFRRLCSLKGLEVHIIPMSEHHPTYCAEDIELWEVVRVNSDISNSITSKKEIPEFQLKDWGEDKIEVRFELLGREFSVKQLSSMGVGGAVWPSSVICSRKIMQKEFQRTLAEKLFTSLLNRHGGFFAGNHHHHHRRGDYNIVGENLNSLSQRWNREELETKKKNLDFQGVTVLDLGNVLPYCHLGHTYIVIGAGCGLTSIVFHSLGFNVVATDRLSIMNILEENLHHYLAQVEPSGKSASDSESESKTSQSATTSSPSPRNSQYPFLKILPFDWELEHDSLKISENNIDLILCSDCLYNSIVVEPLIRVIQMNIKKELLVLLVNELRTSLEEFLYLIRHYDANYEVTVEEVLITEPELELIRTNDAIKFSPPIRMCFIKFVKITHSTSFDDISQDDGSVDHPDNYHRQSSESLEDGDRLMLEEEGAI